MEPDQSPNNIGNYTLFHVTQRPTGLTEQAKIRTKPIGSTRLRLMQFVANRYHIHTVMNSRTILSVLQEKSRLYLKLLLSKNNTPLEILLEIFVSDTHT